MYGDHELDDETFVSVDECAARLGLSVRQVEELAAKGLLRARRHGGWLLEVQPALIRGVTTSTSTGRRAKTEPEPKPELAQPEPAPAPKRKLGRRRG